MSKLLKSSAILSLITLLSRMLGLVRDIVVARYFSVEQTDVFFTALRIPNTLRRFFAEGGFANAFVPVLVETKETQTDKELQSLINHVFGVLGSFLLLITFLGVIFSGSVLAIVGFGFSDDGERFALGATLLSITFPYIFFISMTAFFAGILNAYQKFALPAFVPCLLNVSLIVFAIYFRDDFSPDVMSLAWAVFVGGLIQFLIQIPTLWRLKRLPVPKFSLAHQGVRKILKLMVPTLIGSSAGQINILLNTALASSLVSGSISWLYYSDRLVELPIALIGVALGIVILPRLSATKANQDMSAFKQTFEWAFKIAFMVGSAAACGLFVLAYPLMSTLFSRGAFTEHSVQMAAASLSILSVSAFSFVMVKVLVTAFYAQKNTKTPAKIAVMSIIVNVTLSLLLYKTYGYLGLATASVIASLMNALSLFVILSRHGVILMSYDMISFTVKVIWANAFLIMSLWGVQQIFMEELVWQTAPLFQKTVQLLILIVLGKLVYLIALALMRVKPITLLRSI